jgi:ATP synthase protein I
MKLADRLPFIGKWAFIVGLVLALVVGYMLQAEWAIWVLAILGVIVGLLNVTGEDTEKFLLAAIAFGLSATALVTVPVLGFQITNALSYVAAFVAGAMVVVALKVLFQTARS